MGLDKGFIKTITGLELDITGLKLNKNLTKLDLDLY